MNKNATKEQAEAKCTKKACEKKETFHLLSIKGVDSSLTFGSQVNYFRQSL